MHDWNRMMNHKPRHFYLPPNKAYLNCIKISIVNYFYKRKSSTIVDILLSILTGISLQRIKTIVSQDKAAEDLRYNLRSISFVL